MMEKLPRDRKQEQHKAHQKNGNFEYSYLIKDNVDLYQVPQLLNALFNVISTGKRSFSVSYSEEVGIFY